MINISFEFVLTILKYIFNLKLYQKHSEEYNIKKYE